MSVDEAREKLLSRIAEVAADPALSNYLVRGNSLAAGVVTRVSLENALADLVTKDVLDHAERAAEREFLAYDPSYQLASNQVIADDISEVPAIQSILEVIARDDVAMDEPSTAPVVAMVHRVRSRGDAALTVLRLKGAGIATRRPRGLKALLPREGVLHEVGEEIVFYEPKFDVLVSGADIIVSTITLLSRKLDSPQRAQERARQVFGRATARIAIKGADDLVEAVASDPAMIAKMMALSRLLDQDPEYAELLTTERVVTFLLEHPHIEIDIEGEGDDAQLVFDPSPQKRYRIVKALADDYLSSQLSGRNYEAGSKQRL